MTKRITLLAQKGSRLAQRKKSVTKKPARSGLRTGSKKVVKRVVVRKARMKNPTQAERGAVATRWSVWGAQHGLTAAKINEGSHVIKVMPDPTRIKDFSALAQMLGVRGKNPVAKRRTLKKPGAAGGNWAVATQVAPGKFRIAGWCKTQDEAVDRAEKAGIASGKPVYVLDRAKYNALTK